MPRKSLTMTFFKIVFFGFICFFSALASSLTTLSKFQKSVHVLVVQSEEPLFDSGYWQVKLIDTWTENEIPSNSFYTFLEEEVRGKMFIGAYGSPPPYKSLEDRLKTLIRVNSHNENFIKNIKRIAKRLSEKEKKGIYLHPWYGSNTWPIFKTTKGEFHVSGCIDGLTDQPLINPSLKQVKDLALSKVNDPPNVNLVGLFWPAGEEDDFNGLRCDSSNFDKAIHRIKNLF